MKKKIIDMASNSSVSPLIQEAAQDVLRHGWSILFPTAHERVTTLKEIMTSVTGFYNFLLYLNSIQVNDAIYSIQIFYP